MHLNQAWEKKKIAALILVARGSRIASLDFFFFFVLGVNIFIFSYTPNICQQILRVPIPQNKESKDRLSHPSPFWDTQSCHSARRQKLRMLATSTIMLYICDGMLLANAPSVANSDGSAFCLSPFRAPHIKTCHLDQALKPDPSQ